MSCGIQRDPICALTKTLEILTAWLSCPSNPGQHRPPGALVLPGWEEGGDERGGPRPWASAGTTEDCRVQVQTLLPESRHLLQSEGANNSFLLFCEDNQRRLIFESILSPSPSTLPTYMQEIINNKRSWLHLPFQQVAFQFQSEKDGRAWLELCRVSVSLARSSLWELSSQVGAPARCDTLSGPVVPRLRQVTAWTPPPSSGAALLALERKARRP